MTGRDDQARRIAERFPGPRGPKGDTGAAGRKGEPLSPALRRALAYLFVLVFLLIGVAYWGLYRQQQVNDHRWCGTLDLLTAHPVPRPADPAANPSRENAYIFYADISDLRGQFGCG